MDDRPKLCIDRILHRDLMRLQLTKPMRDGGRRAIAPIGKTWMNGSTLRVRYMGGKSKGSGVFLSDVWIKP